MNYQLAVLVSVTDNVEDMMKTPQPALENFVRFLHEKPYGIPPMSHVLLLRRELREVMEILIVY